MGTKYSYRTGGIGLSALFAALLPSAAMAGTVTATAKVIVLRPLSFFVVQDMDLGDIIPGAVGGTVRLFPNGTRTSTGSIVLSGATHQPARFAGLGTPNQMVSITIPAASINLTGPGTPMTLSLFEIGSTPTAILGPVPSFFRIGSAIGNFNFPVGGTLAVGGDQAAGTYSGTFTITLNYL